MPLSTLSIDGFAIALSKWAIAFNDGDPAAMKSACHDIQYAGELIVLYTEFRNGIQKTAPSGTPEEALQCMTAFLHVFTDIVQQQWNERDLGW